MSNKESTGYSATELEEFKGILEKKLEEARSDMEILKGTLESISSDAKGDDFAVEQFSRAEVQQLILRQAFFIEALEAAMGRIANRTYGFCRVTGKLIPKERLRLVPHATLSIEARQMGNSN